MTVCLTCSSPLHFVYSSSNGCTEEGERAELCSGNFDSGECHPSE